MYILRELSKSFPSLWVRVFDSDGEFLLIEAAKVTPKWLSPENDAHRVWIHAGQLLLIPAGIAPPSKPLSLHDAIAIIKSTPPAALTHSPLVEAEAFYRLEKYPAHISASLHHAPVTIPRKLAHILHACPKSVAPAVEAFYTRDPRALRPLLAAQTDSLTFPPTDLVTVSVRFTKVLYAQLKAQHFPPPPVWRDVFAQATTTTLSLPPTTTSTTTPQNAPSSPSSPENDANKTLARLDLGMKLTTGFELLAQTTSTSPNRLVREVGLLLADLAEDGGDTALPSDAEIAAWEGVEREDDEGWMDVDFEGLQRELDGKGGEKDGKEGFGDVGEQEGLRRMVERFEAFLNDEGAGVEGAEVEGEEMDVDDEDEEEEEDDSEGGWEDEDREVSFDEEMFARMMREMMGLPGEEGGGEKGKGRVVEEVEDEDENDVEEIRKMTEQMEAELKGHGALQLDPKPKTVASIKEKGEGPSKAGPAEEDAEDSNDEVDIDYNLAKNLLESFKSQAGMAGPAGNLLGLMGMSLPRDEEDADDEQK